MIKNDELKNNLKVTQFFLKIIWKRQKIFFLYIILTACLNAGSTYWPIIMMRSLINQLIDKNIEQVIKSIILLVVGSTLLLLISNAVNARIDIINIKLIKEFEAIFGEKIISMDFEDLEDNKTLEAKELSLEPIRQQNALFKFINNIKEIAVSIITIIVLGIVISSLSFWIILIIISIVLLNSFIYKKAQNAQFGFWKVITPINRKFGYYKNLANDYSMAKDIRIYNMKDYILNKIDKYDKESYDGFKNLFLKIGVCQGGIEANVQLQMFFIYIYMLYIVAADKINIGDFTMYISAAQCFASGISRLSNFYIDLKQVCKYLSEYMNFVKILTNNHRGNDLTDDIKKIKIEFRNVSFKYPNQEDYVLKNVCLQINNGEKIAIVGKNGAGKTTFIKLLCRLYVPTDGDILLNDINIMKYDFNEYMKLLSVVFQDYKIFSFSVKENILGNQDYDYMKMENVINEIGLNEKINNLNKRMEANLLRVFDEEGIEFSGGENQKLAIARALYKNAPLIILDEATAALDPVAEYEIYEKFSLLTEGKTTIFISHRMSACRLCDKIAVFSDGNIIEYGNHEELLKKNGLYKEMWTLQAKFYN